MKRTEGTRTVLRNGFAALILMGTLCFSVAQATTHAESARNHNSKKTAVQPAATEAPAAKSGLLSWLEGLIPSGIRLAGPAIGPENQEEVLATANCFQSGAGVSCNGFRSLKDYVAATHVSQRLGIPFNLLKAKMQSGKSLREAIRELRPGADYKTEAGRAEEQAQKTLKNLSS